MKDDKLVKRYFDLFTGEYVEEKKIEVVGKKQPQYFEIINALFTDKNYINNLTAECARQNLFVILRRLAIKYPDKANCFNDGKCDELSVLKYWSDFLYNGGRYPDKWVYTSVKKEKVKDDITKSDIKEYKKYYDITDNDYSSMMSLFPEETRNEIIEHRELMKKLNSASIETQKIKK